jgi:hypothetical protein
MNLLPGIIAGALWLCATHTLRAGWTIDGSNILYSEKQSGGSPSFADALQKLASQDPSAQLRSIELSGLLADPDLEKELAAALERDSPREWHEALKSAGNMHNPKMLQLAKPFQKAVLATPSVKDIVSVLSAHHLVVTKVSYEELQLIKSETSGRRFIGFVWLIVAKAPDASAK